MRYTKHSIIRTGCLFLLTALAASVIAGCSGSSSHDSNSSTPTAFSTNTVRASASHSTVLQLHDGAMLVIPAGAMTEGAVVTATYTSPPKDDQTDQAPIGPQVHFSVEPANAIRHPLLLEFPLSNDEFPVAARYGAYSVATFDPSSNHWVDVASAYDPDSNMLVTNISHFSWWTTVKQAAHYALIVAKCIPSGVGGGITSLSWSSAVRSFLTCLVKAGVSDLSSSLAGRFLSSLIPKSCWSALAIDGLVGSPASVLKGIFTEPACTGHAGETVPPATVTAVSPTSGSTSGGNTIVITGTLFQLANQVLIGETPAHFSIATNSNSSITATVPAHAAGIVDVRVVTGGGPSATSSADRYIYVPSKPSTPPTVTPIVKPPTVTPAPPTTRSIQIGWSGSHSTWIWMTLKGFAPGSYQYTCSFNTGGNRTFTINVTANPQTFDNGHTCYDTVSGDKVWVVIGSVKSNVIAVASSPPPPPPPPPPPGTHAETAGPSGGNTFTNPANAGAPLGQHVAAYQTIQVSCRLTGFKVADGNTWWYKIASSPWNNAFYAPADNYYNNGQTSGSLSGTPFVDTAVPMC